MSINSNDWNAEGLNNVRCKRETSSISRISGETDLIIRNKMDAAVSGEFRQFAK
jgi:hypothetical protein